MAALSLVTGLLPVVLLLCGLVLMDSFQLVSRRDTARSLVFGAAAAALAWGFNRLAIDVAGIPAQPLKAWIAPVVEEAIKLAWIVALIRRGRIGFLVDGAIHGFAVGAGFAVVENLYYVNALSDAPYLLWVVRGLGTAIMHGGATAIAAILARDQTGRHDSAALRRFLPGFAAAAAVHAGFNQLPFTPLVTTACIVLALPLLLVVAFDYSERQTRDWLGTSMDREVELLALMDEGRIAASPVGRYLTSLRERFPGPVVADMLCLLQIHAELALRAKGLLIAREAGVELPPDPEVGHRLRELRFLEGSIGPTGHLALLPFLRTGQRDRWQLRMLEARGQPPERPAP